MAVLERRECQDTPYGKALKAEVLAAKRRGGATHVSSTAELRGYTAAILRQQAAQLDRYE